MRAATIASRTNTHTSEVIITDVEFAESSVIGVRLVSILIQ